MNKISSAITNGSELGWLISPVQDLIMVYQGDRFPEKMSGADVLSDDQMAVRARATAEKKFAKENPEWQKRLQRSRSDEIGRASCRERV
jgi:hypothetical protein